MSPIEFWVYGVGFRNDSYYAIDESVCLGAKTGRYGTGGNAIPFTCTIVGQGQTRWTPGGQSNWGYATVINQLNRLAWGTSLMNYRP